MTFETLLPWALIAARDIFALCRRLEGCAGVDEFRGGVVKLCPSSIGAEFMRHAVDHRAVDVRRRRGGGGGAGGFSGTPQSTALAFFPEL